VPEKVIVTGAAGFIGSHVVEALLARGDVVVGIDNFDSFYDPDLKRANLAEAMLHPSFELVEADVRDTAAMRRVIDAFHPDAIVHLAARAGVRPSIQDPALYAAVNVLGTTVLLDAGRAA
jgi:UDP-glucuronate 4-epimerase